MSCAACQARVEKAVSKIPGVTECAVSLLTNSMGVDGDVDPSEIIAAVEKAGYEAKLKGGETGDGTAAREDSISAAEDALMDKETPILKKRLVSSLGFLAVLMYFSMGHMMLGFPIPGFFDGNANTAVHANGLGQIAHVGAHCFANIGYFGCAPCRPAN